jgi:pimeloyl-ACP methyl ester carboxylesterase
VSQRRGATFEVKVDDRILTAEASGPDDGRPVFLLHGTPGSRTGPKPRTKALHHLGVRLISYDRPGYGGSTRMAGRSVADAAADVDAVARELGITRFSVVGRSGGGPHALACAALLPDRVTRTAVLVSVAPSNAPGLDWFGGMANGNVEDYSIADNDKILLAARLRARATRTLIDPATLIDGLRAQMTEADKRIVDDRGIRRQLFDAFAEAMREGPYGWIDDVFALRGDWGFDLGSIRSKVRIWHGTDDNFSPVEHARWLARQIPDTDLQLQAVTAHFGAVEALPHMLNWLAAWRDDPPLPATAPAEHSNRPAAEHSAYASVRTAVGR